MGFDFNAEYTDVDATDVVDAPVTSANTTTSGFDFNAEYTDVSDDSTTPIPAETATVSSAKDASGGFLGLSIFSGPTYNKTPEYKKAFDAKMQELKLAKEEKRKQELKLDEEKATAIKGKQYKETELSEQFLPEIFTGKKYTTDSIMGFAAKRRRELQESGFTGNVDHQIISDLAAKGATTLDIQEYSQNSRGVLTGAQMAKAVLDPVNLGMEFMDTLQERVVSPFVSRAMEYKHAVFSIAADVSRISEGLGLIEEGTVAKAQKAITESRAVEDAIVADYKATYGNSGVSTLMTAAELINLARYAPVGASGSLSWTKMAFADGAYAAFKAKGDGYDAIQAGAHGVGAFVLTKGLGKVLDTAPAIWNTLKGSNPNLKSIEQLSDLPSKHMKAVRELQRINGWDDKQTIEIINGFREGTATGKINALETVRLLAQNSYDASGRELFKDSILYNSKAATTFLDETTARSNNILKLVDSQTTLGKILNQNKLARHGKVSIDWRGVQVAAEKAGINMNSTIMKRIAKNADAFEDWDLAYHKMIVNKLGGVPNTIGETIAKTAYQLTEAAVGKAFANMMHTAILVPITPAKAMVRIAKELVPYSTIRTKITKMVSESLVSGKPINPIQIRAEFKRANPYLTDAQLDKELAKVVDLSQKSKRQIIKEEQARIAKDEAAAKARATAENLKWQKMSDEEANIAYRDEEARMKALSMERAQKEADDTAMAEATMTKVKDEFATAKTIASFEREKAKSDLVAAKVAYKARQVDLKAAKKAEKANPNKQTVEAVQQATEAVKKAHTDVANAIGKTEVKEALKTPTTIKYSNKARTAVKSNINVEMKGATEEGKAASRVAREVTSIHAFGKEFTDAFNIAHKDGTTFSSYLIKNASKVDAKQVKEYYMLNPSRLADGRFGIPKSIQAKFDIPQRYIKVPKSISDSAIKEASKPLAKQSVEMQAENRLGMAKTGKSTNPKGCK
jgi:hypothetical protein